MNTDKNILPLLVQGLFSSTTGTNQSLQAIAGTRINWTNTLVEGRGDLVALDLVQTNFSVAPISQTSGTFDVFIGSSQIITNAESSRYNPSAYARSYELLQIRQRAGQTIQLNYRPTDVYGLVIHNYYENRFAIPAILQARQTSALKQRIQDFSARFTSQVRLAASDLFTVPTGLGNVVAIEFDTYTDVASDVLSVSTFSVDVNGVQIVQDAAAIGFSPSSYRPGLIFPILIRGGSTFRILANTQFATNPGEFLIVNIRLYFDDDNSGTREYL